MESHNISDNISDNNYCTLIKSIKDCKDTTIYLFLEDNFKNPQELLLLAFYKKFP